MPHPFQVSDKIICTNPCFEPEMAMFVSEFPRFGHIYNVRGIRFNTHGAPVVTLTGIAGCRPAPLRIEAGFRADRFRLVRAGTEARAGA